MITLPTVLFVGLLIVSTSACQDTTCDINQNNITSDFEVSLKNETNELSSTDLFDEDDDFSEYLNEDIEVDNEEDNNNNLHNRQLLVSLKSKTPRQNHRRKVAKKLSIYFTCDNQFKLYVNGRKIGSGNNWKKTYHFNTKIRKGDVIAFEGIDKGGPAAFIGKFGNRVTKPSDWLCSLRKSRNWNKNNFNTRSWFRPKSYGKNRDRTVWKSVSGRPRPYIPGNAEWLWSNNNNSHNRLYCRYYHKFDQNKSKSIKHFSNKTHYKLNVLKRKVQSMFDNLVKDNNKQLSQLSKNLDGSNKSLQKTNTKYHNTIRAINNLKKEIRNLRKSIKTHYNQMLSDSKYLKKLKMIKPGFLRSLTQTNSKLSIVQNLINKHIIESSDKQEMINLVNDIRNATHYSTNDLSKKFLDHYEKYKKVIKIDQTEYSQDKKDLNKLVVEYNQNIRYSKQLKREYNNINQIVQKLRTSIKLSKEETTLFKQLMDNLSLILSRKSCRTPRDLKYNLLNNQACATDLLNSHVENQLVY